jgi:hypothetical protein
MKKAMTVLVLSLVVLVAFGMEAKAQIPKEGTFSFKYGYSGTSKVLAMGQERLQIAFECMGGDMGDTPDDLFHNTSFRCVGAFHAVKGEYNDGNMFCVATRLDGDQIFTIHKFAGKLGGMSKSTYTIVGGTGKLAGIQGSGGWTGFDLRPSAEGTFQAYGIMKGQYKLP